LINEFGQIVQKHLNKALLLHDMVKLICSDIDGTLLNKDRDVDIYTKQVFNKLAGQMQVVLASSRMPKALWYIQEALSIQQMPLICYNGALVLSAGKIFDDGLVLHSSVIPANITNSIFKLAKLHNLHISLYYNNTWIASEMDFWAGREINNTRATPDLILSGLPERSRKEKINEPAHKVMLMGEAEKLDIIEQELFPKGIVSLYRSKSTYLEISPIGIDKSSALNVVLTKVSTFNNITLDNVIAFGDSYNDYEMLKAVKYGIAVANGVQKIKDIAYAITKSNQEHGVATYLEEMFLTGEHKI